MGLSDPAHRSSSVLRRRRRQQIRMVPTMVAAFAVMVLVVNVGGPTTSGVMAATQAAAPQPAAFSKPRKFMSAALQIPSGGATAEDDTDDPPRETPPPTKTGAAQPQVLRAAGPSLATAFVEVTKGLDKVWTVACVGPRLESDVLEPAFGRRVAPTSCAARDDVVLLECREARTDLSDANRLSANAVGALCVGDVVVYIVSAHEARAPPNGKYLSGLVAGLERALATGRHQTAKRLVVVAVAGDSDDALLATIDRQVKGAWRFAVGKPRGFAEAEAPRFVVARAKDVDGILGIHHDGAGDLGPLLRSLAAGGSSSSASDAASLLAEDDAGNGESGTLSDERRARALAEVLRSAETTAFPRYRNNLRVGPPTTFKLLSKRQAVEVAAGARLSDACDALLADGGPVDAAKDTLARQALSESEKFCETYADECETAANDALDRLDDALDESSSSEHAASPGLAMIAGFDWTETDAYSRKRRYLKQRALDKLDDAFLDKQLQALAQQTAQRLRSGLKNLRISKSMTAQTETLLKEADSYFETKAAAAFGPARPWRAKQKQVRDALRDYVDERLQVARLQGTFLPDDQDMSPLAKVWPFPITLAVHWLVPSAMGVREQQARGLTEKDKQAFNLVEGQTARLPIPAAISQFTRNLVSQGSAAAPVE